MRRADGGEVAARGTRLCTIGNLVHDPGSNGPQDVETYQSLARYGVERLYLIARSPGRNDMVIRSGRVVVVGIGLGRGVFADRIGFALGAVRLGLRLNREARIDVFAVSDPLISGIVGILLRAVTRKPLLVHLQSELINLEPGWMNATRSRAISFITRSVCRRADLVRCVSRSIARNVAAHGVPAKKIVYLPTRVDLMRFAPEALAKQRQSARVDLGLADRKVVLFAGTLTKRKGVDELVEVLPEIASRHPDVALLIVGEGILGTHLRERGRQLGVSDRLTFLGSTTHHDIPRLFAAADVLVLPSLNEGMPRVILEGLASGLPVVAADVGGVSEVVEDRRTGLLVPAGDRVSLAHALTEVLDDTEAARAWGLAGREKVKQGYERESNLREYARLVTSLASERSTR